MLWESLGSTNTLFMHRHQRYTGADLQRTQHFQSDRITDLKTVMGSN